MPPNRYAARRLAPLAKLEKPGFLPTDHYYLPPARVTLFETPKKSMVLIPLQHHASGRKTVWQTLELAANSSYHQYAEEGLLERLE